MKLSPLVRAMLWMAAAQGCVCAQEHLTIAVFNYAGVSDSVLATGIENARLIFHKVGIETVWPVCDAAKGWPEACTRPLPDDGKYLEMMVMPRMIAPPPGSSAESHPAGYALTGVALIRPRAYVFYAETQDAAAAASRRVSLVLGCVMLHEAAHLLGLRHQTRGLMRPNLDPHDVDFAAMGLGFNSIEEKQLHASVIRFAPGRTAVAAAGRR